MSDPPPDPLENRLEAILAADPGDGGPAGVELGRSREGRPVTGHRLGDGPLRISLIAGCHADEPAGPRLLRHLAAYLGSLPPEDPLLALGGWWLVPHANPDGEVRNRSWQDAAAPTYDPAAYLLGAVRELPGDDLEFSFPRDPGDRGARPENRAIYDWWREAEGPFHIHASLHGMSFAAGPWFLIEPRWHERARPLQDRLGQRVAAMGYRLHDVERLGEKGFFRLGSGFATRPDSRNMRDHFLARGDLETAERFRPSSMETMRSLAGDVLTLVSEVPLFVTPGVGEILGPPDPAALAWRERVTGWREALAGGEQPEKVRLEARQAGLQPIPVKDQMVLQWAMIAAGIELAEPGSAAART